MKLTICQITISFCADTDQSPNHEILCHRHALWNWTRLIVAQIENKLLTLGYDCVRVAITAASCSGLYPQMFIIVIHELRVNREYSGYAISASAAALNQHTSFMMFDRKQRVVCQPQL